MIAIQQESIVNNGLDKFLNYNFALVYSGNTNADLTNLVNDLNQTEIPNRRKISFLAIESFQNVIKHSVNNDLSKKFPVHFSIYGTHNQLEINTVNLISNENKLKFIAKFNEIKDLPKSRLDEIYIQSLGENQLTKSGAKLGLIEMMRKSNKGIHYQFRQVSEDFSLLFFQIKLGENSLHQNDKSLERLEENYQFFNDQEIIFMKKGDFSSNTIAPLFKLFEKIVSLNGISNESNQKLIAYTKLVLQNIANQSLQYLGQKNALFCLQKSNQNFKIITKNYINQNVFNLLNQFLEEVEKNALTAAIQSNSLHNKKLSHLIKIYSLAGSKNVKTHIEFLNNSILFELSLKV